MKLELKLLTGLTHTFMKIAVELFSLFWLKVIVISLSLLHSSYFGSCCFSYSLGCQTLLSGPAPVAVYSNLRVSNPAEPSSDTADQGLQDDYKHPGRWVGGRLDLNSAGYWPSKFALEHEEMKDFVSSLSAAPCPNSQLPY